jgi:enamine deaminase RidA (YjgF/YER057c/UK114 family)
MSPRATSKSVAETHPTDGHDSPSAALPTVRRSTSPYLRNVVHDGVMHVSGQLPYDGDEITVTGAVGDEVTVEQAKDAARLCALNVLATVSAELGDLARIRQVLRVTGYVACAPGFGGQPQIMNAASAVFVERLGERGRHARTALGVAALPHNAPVEIDVTLAVDTGLDQ